MPTELLSPAGDRESLAAALRFGADAVYIGGETLQLRAKTAGFDREAVLEAVKLAHEAGKRLYVAMNSLAKNGEIPLARDYARFLRDAGVDAAIVSDIGVLTAVRESAPGLELHLSTQASCMNYAAARAWHDLGVKRIVLAREMSIDDIAQLRAKTPASLELEAFVHGAMCMAYSGRCLLSSCLSGRSGNRGECAQPCRWSYALVEEKRPGEYFPVLEDEKGSYILNSRDMCMIDHVGELMDAGLDSLKIEGRAKSAYYAAVVTGAYRHAVDAALAGEPLDPVWREEVEKVSHRHYSTGFWFGQPGQYTEDARYIRAWQVVAQVVSCDETGDALCVLNNKFGRGDALELTGPGLRPAAFTAEGLRDDQGVPVPQVRTPGSHFRLKLPCRAPALSYLRREVGESRA